MKKPVPISRSSIDVSELNMHLDETLNISEVFSHGEMILEPKSNNTPHPGTILALIQQ